MKLKTLGMTVAASSIFVAVAAFAAVDSMTIRFAGGCHSTSTGACSIKLSAEGSDLGSAAVRLQHSATQKGPWRNVGAHSRTLSSSGLATFKFKNVDGCYRAITDENGNDNADVVSRKICEK